MCDLCGSSRRTYAGVRLSVGGSWLVTIGEKWVDDGGDGSCEVGALLVLVANRTGSISKRGIQDEMEGKRGDWSTAGAV